MTTLEMPLRIYNMQKVKKLFSIFSFYLNYLCFKIHLLTLWYEVL